MTIGRAVNLLSVLFAIGISSMAGARPKTLPHEQICRAAIATVMSRDLAIVRVDRVRNGEIEVSYIRPDDRSRWNYKCKVEGLQVLWGAHGGRWRDLTADGKLTYEIHDKELGIEERFADGSMNYQLFPLNKLR